MKPKFPKILYFLLCFLLIFEQSLPAGRQMVFAQVAGELDLSAHFARLASVLTQDKFRPLHLRYLSYDHLNNNFKLLLDQGDSMKGLSPSLGSARDKPETVPEEKLKRETKTLLNYFFVGISLPNDSFWVNLRPDSPENIIDPYLGRTDVGRILLEADLQLKKDTAGFTSPQTSEGKKYWDKLYKKAGELFGSENITIPTLTRPWIVPNEIIIRESADNAYIYKATLKVMLEQDYLKDSAVYNFKDERLKILNEYSSQLIRETIIPKLTREVNTAQKYAPLRQVYYSLILSQWFKQKFSGKGGLYSYLIDQRNLTGLTSKEPWSKTSYFQAYQKSFREGEYNIKEPVYALGSQSIRSYMSGGMDFSNTISLAIAAGKVISSRGSSPLINKQKNIVVEFTEGELKITLEPAEDSLGASSSPILDKPYYSKIPGYSELEQAKQLFDAAGGLAGLEKKDLPADTRDQYYEALVRYTEILYGATDGGLVTPGFGWQKMIDNSDGKINQDKHDLFLKQHKSFVNEVKNAKERFDALRAMFQQPKVKKGISGGTAQGRLDYLYPKIIGYLDSMAKGRLGAQARIVVVGIGDKGAPTVFDLYARLKEAGFNNLIIQGVDISPEFVRKANQELSGKKLEKGLSLEFKEGDLFKLKELGFDNNIDIIIAANTFLHFDYYGQYLGREALCNGLTQDGSLVIARSSVDEAIYFSIFNKKNIEIDNGKISQSASSPAAEKQAVTKEEIFLDTMKAVREKMRGTFCLPHAKALVQALTEKGIPAEVYVTAQEWWDLADKSIVHFWVQTGNEDGYILDVFPEGLGEFRKNAIPGRDKEATIIIEKKNLNNFPVYASGKKASETIWRLALNNPLEFSASPVVASSPVSKNGFKTAIIGILTGSILFGATSMPWAMDKIGVDSSRSPQSVEKIIALAPQINIKDIQSLYSRASNGNSIALDTLGTLASQGNSDAVEGLEALADQGNSIAKERLRRLDTTRLSQLASQGNSEIVRSLGRIAVYNPRAFDALSALTTYKETQPTAEEALRNFVSLPIINQMNNLHSSPDKIRFNSVSTAQANLLYTLMVYGQEELYTSSFNGLFNRLLERMRKEGLSGEQLLVKMNYNKFRVFIKLCASFNRLNEFLDTFDSLEARKQFIQSFVKDLDKTKDPLGEAVVVADMFGIIQDKNILVILQETMRNEYERVLKEGKKEPKALYGLLAGMFSQKAVINNEWLQEMAKQYQLANILEMPQSALVDAQGRHIEQYFFSNDEDGEASFKNFSAVFKSGNWRLEDAPHYICFKSTSGIPVIIYANKPKFEEEGQNEISRIFEKENLKPQVIVHRGHSTHVSKTIDAINPDIQFVYLGSCGGYINAKDVLDRSPAAHMLTTKGMGTMLVNDPLLRAIAEHIRQGQGINWPRLKKEAEIALSKNEAFQNYIFPHENLGVMFLKAYKGIILGPDDAKSSSSLNSSTSTASSPIVDLQMSEALDKLDGLKVNGKDGEEFVFEVEKRNNEHWDRIIKLKNTQNEEIGFLELSTKSDGLANARYLRRTNKAYSNQRIGELILSAVRRVFPEGKTIKTGIAHAVSLAELKQGKPFGSIEIVELFKNAGWELIGQQYVSGNRLPGQSAQEDWDEDLLLKDEEGFWEATFRATRDQPYLPGFSPEEINKASAPIEDKKGGIDFRALPIVTQPALANSRLNLNLAPLIPLVELGEEWQRIENMLAAGITPSSERIKEYLQSCSQKQDCNQDIDKVLSCIADILRLEEEKVVSTEPSLKAMLMLLESDKPVAQMQLALAQITIEAKKPKGKAE